MSGGLLIFDIAGHAFAVDESHVEEIAEAVPTTRLPFAPVHVEGIANVAGHLLPIVDLTGYPALDLTWPANRKGGLFVVLRSGAGTLALRAGRIGGTLAREAVEPQDAGPSPIAAHFDHAGRGIRLIDPARIELGHGMAFADLPNDAALVGVAASPLNNGAPRPTVRLLIVEAGGRGYALDMRDIVLIFAITDLRPLPNAPAIVRGMSQVQHHPVLLVDVFAKGPHPNPPPPDGGGGNSTFPRRQVGEGGARAEGVGGRGLAAAPSASSGHAVVYATPHGPVAVQVNSVRGVVRFTEDQLKATERNDGSAPDEIVEYDGTWLEVRSGTRMLGDHLDDIGRLIPEARELDDSRLPQRHYRRFLTFTVDGRVYAVEFERVRRVVESSERLRLPNGGQSFDGITDVDGAILPILDLRRLLTRRPVGADPSHLGTAILVEIAGGTVAVVADEVQRIRKVPSDNVDPMSDRLTSAVIRLDNALIPVLRPEGLMPDTVPARLPSGALA
ncbi:chemotaxis protein CheW [Azospirillum soli]|uniref:chemotaxis protein CheW n=1 Tax=Azospirillum soli TaxID=1304799 RepID=UPI001AE70478|nr:chemotaxis protein CheW [Azospirillum soli]MBP2312461.1 chemotaxis signal transduction protein [Azospirillum soli]